MSVYVMSLVTKSSVPFPERYTLLALADYANDAGVCWPAVATLAEWGQIGESTVRRHLRALVQDGIVAVDWRDDASSLYTVRIWRLKELKRPSRSDTRQSGKGCQSGRGKERPPAQTADYPDQSDSGSQDDSGSRSEHDTPPDLSEDPSQIGSQTINEPSGEPSLLALDFEATPPPETRVDLDAEFDKFWAVWPRKDAKAEARRCYKKAIKKGATPEHVLAAATRKVAQWTAERTQKKHIPHATTWLNQERYDDEPDLRVVSNLDNPWNGYQRTGTESPWARDMGWR